jgi:hypothetical protein
MTGQHNEIDYDTASVAILGKAMSGRCSKRHTSVSVSGGAAPCHNAPAVRALKLIRVWVSRVWVRNGGSVPSGP